MGSCPKNVTCWLELALTWKSDNSSIILYGDVYNTFVFDYTGQQNLALFFFFKGTPNGDSSYSVLRAEFKSRD